MITNPINVINGYHTQTVSLPVETPPIRTWVIVLNEYACTYFKSMSCADLTVLLTQITSSTFL